MFFISLFLRLDLNAQELPGIISYSPHEYAGANQNWDIKQDKFGFIYFANTNGLMQFAGNNWNKFDIVTDHIFRSIATDVQGRI